MTGSPFGRACRPPDHAVAAVARTVPERNTDLFCALDRSALSPRFWLHFEREPVMNPSADWDRIAILAAEILRYRAERAAAESDAVVDEVAAA
jgi:hypothetical protein